MMRLTDATELMSLFIERRGVSIKMQRSPAVTVALRRRPEMRPISPKKSPFVKATCLEASFGSTWISTPPRTSEKKVSE